MEPDRGNPNLVLIRPSLALLLLLIALLSVPAAAHKDHQRSAEAGPVRPTTAPPPAREKLVEHPMSAAVHEAVKSDIARLEAEAALPVHERLLDWLGRIHPFAVHFPLALFPIAWVTLILARRTGDSIDLIRSLIIVAGASGVIAASLGWLNAGWTISDKDPLLLWHRWLGTALALLGAAIALRAWRRTNAASRAMTASLGVLTLGLLAQGWIGGALIHGIDHLNW